MPNFQVTLLGTSSSQPFHGRYPSAQILKHDQNKYLIDCGEGTQMQMTRYGIKRNKIKAIFISHLHGDHVYGLPGLLTSFMHFSRSESLEIYGPLGIKDFVQCTLDISNANLGFELIIKEVQILHQTIYSDSSVTVKTIPLKHNIPTVGYSFEETIENYKINPEKIKTYNLDFDQIKKLKSGLDIQLENGYVLKVEEACYSKERSRKYCYLSDTTYFEDVIPMIQNASLIYHETTYLKDMNELAIARLHSTTEHASTIAKLADVGGLIIGHYSSRYKDVEIFESECRQIFEHTWLGIEGKEYEIRR